MDCYITWPYQIADHNSRITWVYNKTDDYILNQTHLFLFLPGGNFSFQKANFGHNTEALMHRLKI